MVIASVVETTKILLVDDKRQNLIALEAVLRNTYYEIISVDSASKALDHARNSDFAVIISDVMMPNMDGFQFAQELRQIKRAAHTPLIFVTATGMESDDIKKGYSVGALDYLPKPIDSDIIKAKVRILVDLFRRRRFSSENSSSNS